MENIYVKKQEVEIDNKVDFFNYHKVVFRIISLVLGNVVFEYQLKDLLLTLKYFETEREFIDFIASCKKFELLKTQSEKDKIGSQTVYIAKDYVVQNVTKSKKSQYKYSLTDAKTSYYKMFYILDMVKSRSSCKQDIKAIDKVFLSYTTFNVGKTQYAKLYKKLNDKNVLNVNGELMLNDLEYYEVYKILNFKKKNKNSKNLDKIEKILSDEVYMEKLKLTHDRIVSNKNFWDYNLGKISDNKSYFLFFNPNDNSGYKFQNAGTLDIVKFDVSENFGNAEIGDYVAKVMESIKHHVKEEYKNINMYIYFADEDTKDKTFVNSVNHKISRNGVRNLDSNLTARIKETSRKVYQCKLISFSNPKIDFNNKTVSYRIYYKSQATAPDDFYTLTLHFRNADFENDIYSKEDIEKKRVEEELRRNQKQVDKIINDAELLSLLIDRLNQMKK